MKAIQVEKLRKSYGAHEVLRGLDLAVEQGEVFALLGVNGAGKTTALECIQGLRSYEEGQVWVNGRMGVQLQSASLPFSIRAMEALSLFARWNGTRAEPGLLETLGIHELGKQLYGKLSPGQKRRLHLALALVGDPDILFLDEPTAGLDPRGRDSLLEVLTSLHDKLNMTIILVSHSMEDVAKVAKNIIVMNKGTVFMHGSVAEVFERGRELIEIGLNVPQVTQLFNKLNEMGAGLPADIYTVKYAAKILDERMKGINNV